MSEELADIECLRLARMGDRRCDRLMLTSFAGGPVGLCIQLTPYGGSGGAGFVQLDRPLVEELVRVLQGWLDDK